MGALLRLCLARPRGRVHFAELDVSGLGYFVSIDPGVEGCALAVFSEWGRLLCAGLTRPGGVESDDPIWRAAEGVRAAAQDGWAPRARVLVERPKIYPRSRSKADPNDLIVTALVAGGAASALVASAQLGEARFVEPWVWKGDVEKDAMVAKIRERWATPDDLDRVVEPAPSLAHNVWDAVGLGIWWMRELGLRQR